MIYFYILKVNQSANELIGSDDSFYLYKALKEFYKTSFKYESDNIKIK